MPVWLLPALLAAAVAVLVTVAIERMGGRKGGLIGTLPTTIVPACIGIYESAEGLQAFQSAMWITPAGMLIDGIFLYMWRVVPGRLPMMGLYQRLGMTTSLSLGGWAILAWMFASGSAAMQRAGIDLMIPSIVLTVVLAGFGAWACQRNPPAPKGSRPVGVWVLACRGLLAGVAIAAAVVIAQQGGPLLAGIVAVFPAIFLTTMVSLWLSQGEAVQAGAVGPMMLGATSVSVFAILAAWLVPMLGVGWGCALAWLGAAIGFTYPAWAWLERQSR